MQENNLTFAKIVSIPNELSWAQAYNAGKLFAVLSFQAREIPQEKDFLNLLGKDILDTLEQEFFSLETKDLASIKNAVLVTSKKIPEEVICSFVICSVIENILYLFILGQGKIDIKRGEDIGTLLESTIEDSREIKTGSGLLQNDDLLILQTKQFAQAIPTNVLVSSLDHQPPSDIAETLAPKIHGKEDSAGASAIIIKYTSPKIEAGEEGSETLEQKEEVISEEIEKPPLEFKTTQPSELTEPVEVEKTNKIKELVASIFSKIKAPQTNNIPHSKRVILTITILIALVFIISVFFAVKKQQDAKIKAAFEQVYPVAQKKYDEGQSLIGLNENLARESFKASKTVLQEGSSQFDPNSKEKKQIEELLKKVDTALTSVSGINTITPKTVDEKTSEILAAEIKNQGLFFIQDDKNIYFVTSSGVSSIAKGSEKPKQIIKNDDNWTEAGGLGAYLSNFYILDKKTNQIIKFVAAEDGFANANYFPSDVTPDLSKASGIAIDGSIWILLKDGTIEKFTKGKADSFSLSGLEQNLSSPSRIYTDLNIDNVYILDNGNSRIVVVNKKGEYKNQYQASILKNAKDFEVLEKDKKVYVLSGGKIYQIDLK